MNIDTTKKIFATNQNQSENPCSQVGSVSPNTRSRSSGAAHPPRNMMVAVVDNSIMLAYSARKNTAKLIPEYSTMCPATISDSPSTTSNGARLVSATPLTKYTTSIGASGSQFHDRKLSPIEAKVPRPWALTMSDRLRLPDTISTTTSAKPIDSSYDTICAAERIAPRKAYLEFDAQPATITPYTPIELNARMYSSPALMSASTTSGAKGITAHAASAGVSISTGASRNRPLFALVGTMISFISSFTPSAIGCSSPAGPTRLGPMRIWIQPISLRSHSVR